MIQSLEHANTGVHSYMIHPQNQAQSGMWQRPVFFDLERKAVSTSKIKTHSSVEKLEQVMFRGVMGVHNGTQWALMHKLKGQYCIEYSLNASWCFVFSCDIFNVYF